MGKLRCLSRSRPAFVSVTVAFASILACGQQGTPSAVPGANGGQAPANAESAEDQANDAFLAKAARLYYSTRTAGLDGFDCEVHPDWRTLFTSANQGTPIPEDDPRLTTLKPVKITMHARMAGGSTLEWIQNSNSEKPLDADSTALLDQMHQATQQTVQGFLQFWIPFVDGSVVPASSQGLTVTRSATDVTIHGEQSGTEVTEIFSPEMVLQQFNVLTNGVAIKFAPSYQQTEKGLLVNRFDAHIDPLGQASPEATGPRTQDMHVKVDYATIGGLPIPSSLNMEVVGTGTFHLAMDGCRTLLAPK